MRVIEEKRIEEGFRNKKVYIKNLIREDMNKGK